VNHSLKPIAKTFACCLFGLSLSTGGLLLVENFHSSSIGTPAQAQASTSQNPPIETASTQASLALAQHLQNIGAKMYGAYWCPYCHLQKERFGEQAVNQIMLSETAPVYIECSPEGRGSPQAQSCQQAEITAYPTWIIEGEKYEGNLPLEQLAELSGYQGSQDF